MNSKKKAEGEVVKKKAHKRVVTKKGGGKNNGGKRDARKGPRGKHGNGSGGAIVEKKTGETGIRGGQRQILGWWRNEGPKPQ